MISKTFKFIFTVCVVFVSVTSCNFVGNVAKNMTTQPADSIIGTNPGELKSKIKEVLDFAGIDLDKAEITQICTDFTYKPGDQRLFVSVQAVTPKDKNKMAEYRWYDNKDQRNQFMKTELILSDGEGNVVDKYDDFKYMLFSYQDVAKYIDNFPVYCREALEASGYKDKGYVASFSIEKDGDVSIRVKHKDRDSLSLSKLYHISDDGQHIVVE